MISTNKKIANSAHAISHAPKDPLTQGIVPICKSPNYHAQFAIMFVPKDEIVAKIREIE